MPVRKRLTGHMRGAMYVVRDPRSLVVGSHYDPAKAQAMAKKCKGTIETLPNSLTEKAIQAIESVNNDRPTLV